MLRQKTEAEMCRYKAVDAGQVIYIMPEDDDSPNMLPFLFLSTQEALLFINRMMIIC